MKHFRPAPLDLCTPCVIILTLCTAATLALLSCKGESKTRQSTQSGSQTQTDEQPADVSTARSAPTKALSVDPQIHKALMQATEKCTVDDYGILNQCSENVREELEDALSEAKLSALSTLVQAIENAPEPATRRLAAHMLSRVEVWMASAQLEPHRLEEAAIEALLRLAETAPEAVQMAVIKPAVQAAMIRDQTQRVLDLLRTHPDPFVQAAGYRYAMTYGRLEAFDDVKHAAQSSIPVLSRAALQAPLNMYGWSEQERLAICPWALEKLRQPDEASKASSEFAARILIRCGGEFIDNLLQHAESQLDQGEYARSLAQGLSPLCRNPDEYIALERTKTALNESIEASPRKPTELQCSRFAKHFRKVLDDEQLPADVRAYALSGLIEMNPTAKLKRVLRKYRNHPEAEIASAARKGLEKISRSK